MLPPRHLILPAIASVVAMAPAQAAPTRATTIGPAHWDERAEAIVVPFAGPMPAIRTRIGHRPYFFELVMEGRPTFRDRRGATTRPHPTLASWQAVPGPDRVTLTLRYARALHDVDVRFDQRRQALILTPLYPGKRLPALQQPGMAPPRPPETRRPRRPVIATPPPDRPLPRVKPTPRPTPTPTPSLIPRGLATPTPRPLQGAIALSYGSTTIDETNPRGDLLVTVESARLLGASFDVRFLPPEPYRSKLTPEGWSPYWRAELAAYNMAYVMTDINLPFSYRFREDTRLEGAIVRELTREHLYSDVGLGYFARLEEALHTGAPPDLSQAFSFNRLFHGPMLKLAFAIPPEEVVIGGVRGWKLFAEADFAPWLTTDMDKGLPPLPALSFSRSTFGIERDMGPVRARFAYGQWRMTGRDFEERWGVPSLTLTWKTEFPDPSLLAPRLPAPLGW